MSNTLDPRRLTWVKSTYSDGQGGQCVEWSPSYARAHGLVPVRDSKTPTGPTLLLTPAAFTGLLTLARLS
ncbi:DUF397 domain-containing protein [Streptomyces sp. V2]|uniref:DUF397 domain-containing protein n=1 Tax=Streptomyces niveiscabiei TaxID=164115 RepID=A0ABW9I3W3_9ACTN|nr:MULTISPECIES: DUF397 domain-containing protein [Streptomyces]PWG07535.1 DUF397 domain-containing protein [Streptomyces sp. V2]